MLDIKFIIANQAKVEEAIKNKGLKLRLTDLLKAHEERLFLLQKVEKLNADRKTNADKMKGGKPEASLVKAGKKIKAELEKLETEFTKLGQRFQSLMLQVPNLYSDDTPVGADDKDNLELKKWGSLPKFSFQPQDHISLGLKKNLLDTDRGTKVAGFRGYFLKNDLALLHWAVLTYAWQKMNKAGFQMLIAPSLVNELGLVGSGWFPAGKDEVYAVDDQYLAGTSEVAMMAYHADEILPVADLPLKYCGFSPCFRREAGSYGKDTKGLYRLHEFWKVEQVIICRDNETEALKLFEQMLAVSEEILQDLELPYRVVKVCTGDMGLGKYKMYDIETWMPSRQNYSETHSCSYFTDWQTRRLKIRSKDQDGRVFYPHSMNNTVIASPRILIALLENNQQADGSIKIPKVLQPLVGKKLIS